MLSLFTKIIYGSIHLLLILSCTNFSHDFCHLDFREAAMGKSKDLNIKNPVEVYKRRIKKFVCCGCGWFWIGAALFIIGIVLLVFYAEFWNIEVWKK